MKHALMLQAQHKIIPKAPRGALKRVTNAAARSSCQPFRLPADCCEPITKHKSPRGCSASPGLKTSDLNEWNLGPALAAEPGVEPPALPQPRSAEWEGSRGRVFACGWGKPEPFLLPCYTGFVSVKTWSEKPEVMPAPLGSSRGCPQPSTIGPCGSALPGCSARSPGHSLAMLAAPLPPTCEPCRSNPN